jgi:hypothetical protein
MIEEGKDLEFGLLEMLRLALKLSIDRLTLRRIYVRF